MASLTLKGIVKRFGRVEVLGGLDLEVKDGEFCVLLGPSGCGKSTLLNIIAGLIPQDEGAVLVGGQSVDRLTPKERDMAMVFQNYALYPHMSVAGNMGFGLRLRQIPQAVIREKVLEAARLLGIEDLLDRKPKELSGGQRQRVAMGRALVRRPRVFLLDEPLSNLDARLRTAVRLELRQLHRRLEGTMVYVTHDQVEAMTLGDKVVVMKEGRILQAGSPDEVYERPADTFVATFIGSPEMNLYSGRIVLKDGRPHFQGPGFSFDLGGLGPSLEEGQAEVGFRPEDLSIGGQEGLTFEARVEMLSNIGSEKYIHARLGQADLTARAPKEAAFERGQAVALGVSPSRLHVFRQGRRI